MVNGYHVRQHSSRCHLAGFKSQPCCRALDLFSEHISWDLCKGNEYEGVPCGFLCFVCLFYKKGDCLCAVFCQLRFAHVNLVWLFSWAVHVGLPHSISLPGGLFSQALGFPLRKAWRGPEERDRADAGAGPASTHERQHRHGRRNAITPPPHTNDRCSLLISALSSLVHPHAYSCTCAPRHADAYM